MNEQEKEAAARKLYDDCTTIKPRWDQLGEATKSVWVKRVEVDDPHRVWYDRDSGETSSPDQTEK